MKPKWDRVGAVLCVIGCSIALILGYVGVSGTLDTGKQLPYVISRAMLGLFLLGLGALLWLSADLPDEWRKLDSIERRVPAQSSSPPDFAPGQAVAGSCSAGSDSV